MRGDEYVDDARPEPPSGKGSKIPAYLGQVKIIVEVTAADLKSVTKGFAWAGIAQSV
jgi:hypothetical protein